MYDPLTADSPWREWPIDREIVLTRVVEAPRELVYAAWADPHQIPEWFGPAGMAIETETIDLRPGGEWRFDMVAQDGTRFQNRMVFLRMEPPAFIEIEHGGGTTLFRVLVTFDAQSDDKTVITLRQMHPSRAQRDAKIRMGAVVYGLQTLDKLAHHVAQTEGKRI